MELRAGPRATVLVTAMVAVVVAGLTVTARGPLPPPCHRSHPINSWRAWPLPCRIRDRWPATFEPTSIWAFPRCPPKWVSPPIQRLAPSPPSTATIASACGGAMPASGWRSCFQQPSSACSSATRKALRKRGRGTRPRSPPSISGPFRLPDRSRFIPSNWWTRRSWPAVRWRRSCPSPASPWACHFGWPDETRTGWCWSRAPPGPLWEGSRSRLTRLAGSRSVSASSPEEPGRRRCR